MFIPTVPTSIMMTTRFGENVVQACLLSSVFTSWNRVDNNVMPLFKSLEPFAWAGISVELGELSEVNWVPFAYLYFFFFFKLLF